MSNDNAKSTTIACLQHAIADSQDTIRAYDNKAEVLGLLLTVALGITNFTVLTHTTPFSKCLLGASWLVGILAIGLLGVVLNPRKDLFSKITYGTFTPKGTYFLTNLATGPQNTVSELAARAQETDWVSELMFERMKLSLIHDYKHRWFVRSLWLSAVVLLMTAGSVLEGIR